MNLPRILLITHLSPTHQLRASMVHLEAISERCGDRIAWFCTRQPPHQRPLQYDIPHYHSRLLRRPTRAPLGILRRYLNLTIWARILGWQAARFGHEWGAEVIWANLWYEVVTAGREAARLMRVPLAVSIHDDPVEILSEKTHPRWLRRTFAAEFERTLKAASSWGVISAGMATEYQTRYGVQCELLYVGVEVDKCLPPAHYDPSKTRFTIGSIGSVVPEANWWTLIEAVRQLGHKYPNREFRILHLGDLPNHLRSPEVEVTGWLTGQKFREHLAEFDISFLNFWFEGHESSRRIAFPTKTHSYIEAQKPFLALGPADCSVVQFVERYRCGMTCTIPDSQALAETIEALLSRESYHDALKGVANLKSIFSREAFYRHFERFILKALER